MSNTRIDLIAGARPDFVKIAPVYHQLAAESSTWTPRIIHTGQHYDANLSDVFFQDFDLPSPHIHLGTGSGSIAGQTSRVMEAYDRHLQTDRPDITLVVGGVNSTIGCGFAAVQRNIPLVHLEAGLRSFDRSMTEEINRMLTDRMSDLLLTSSLDGGLNLKREGVSADRIQFVGNIMIDTLDQYLVRARQSNIQKELKLEPRTYGLVTLHRPANVDDLDLLSDLMRCMIELSEHLTLVLPTHPRLRKNMDQLDPLLIRQLEDAPGLRCIDPLGYIDFLALQAGARLVLTDSGGVQEETTVLGIPCLTLRDNTERPATVTEGTNRVVGTASDDIRSAFEEALALPMPSATRPRYWDGCTAERVVSALTAFMNTRGESTSTADQAPRVTTFNLPQTLAYRSADVRRELLMVAETGSWQEAPDTAHLAQQCATYAEAQDAVPCADIAGGLAAVRSHFKAGMVAVLGGAAPEDVAAVLNCSAVTWGSVEEPLPANTEMVYVSPMNPGTWESFNVDAVVSAAAEFPEIPFVVDERWFEFTGQSVAEAISMCPNLISLRSMGPAFGLDGLGVGYLLGAHPFVAASVINAAAMGMLPVARRAALVALMDLDYMKEYVETRIHTRTWLATTLRNLGFETWELPGPYLYITGDIPDPILKSSCVTKFDGGWIWVVGTPDVVEDQLAEFKQKDEDVERKHAT